LPIFKYRDLKEGRRDSLSVSRQKEELSAKGKPIAGLVALSWFNSLACHWFNSPNCPPGSADQVRPLALAEIAFSNHKSPHHTFTPCFFLPLPLTFKISVFGKIGN
jgi:hypothetical protein